MMKLYQLVAFSLISFFLPLSFNLESTILEQLGSLQQNLGSLKKLVGTPPQEPLYQKYPQIFDQLPEPYKKIALGALKKEFSEGLNIAPIDINRALTTAWKAVIESFNGNLGTSITSAYIIVGGLGIPSLLEGTRFSVTLKAVHNYKITIQNFASQTSAENVERMQKEVIELTDQLVQNYKIHLMPFYPQVGSIVLRLLEALQKDQELRTLIQNFKFMPTFDRLHDYEGNIMPLIVIYAASGKEKAQRLLNKIYALFKNTAGLDQTPRFNQKVTNIIYFAQGDADYKIAPWYQKYYEQPELIYYKNDITGKIEDYHLQIPRP